MGITVQKALSIAGLTKHQYYYKPKQGKPGRNPSSHVIKLIDNEQSVMISNEVMVDEIISIQLTPELYYGFLSCTMAIEL